MNATPHDRPTHSRDTHDEADRRRDETRDRDRDRVERTSRVGVSQLAAPSTRRWRRAGSFHPKS